MFGLSDLKKTRVYQQAFAAGEKGGKMLAVLPMLAARLTVEQIAQALDLTVDEVRQASQQQPSQ